MGLGLYLSRGAATAENRDIYQRRPSSAHYSNSGPRSSLDARDFEAARREPVNENLQSANPAESGTDGKSRDAVR